MAKLPAEIKRYPIRKNETLQGQDSADVLLLAHIGTLDLTHKKILIINDHFGAISLGLEGFDCTSYTDSYVSKMGLLINGVKKEPLSSLKDLSGIYDFVLMRIPKNMSFFEDILCQLTGHLNHNSKIICTSMVKHLAPSSFELLQKYIGETTTSLAQKKARLVFADFKKDKVASPYPIHIKVDGLKNPLVNHSNLFSREKLDIGTRFFLEHVPRGNFHRILDLGCANGIIGMKAKELNPDATILFSDESAMAIQSAKTNFENSFNAPAEFYWTNCFEGQPKNSLDLVLCNPPFHEQTTVGDFIAMQMFQDAYDALKGGGTIRVIGNSHLGYQVKLKKLFGNSEIIATNSKFMVVHAVKKS